MVRRPAPSAYDFDDEDQPWLDRLIGLATNVPSNIEPAYFYGRVVAFVLFALWTLSFLTYPIASPALCNSFMHLIHLPFHEAGHLIFGIFGWDFLMSLGGSLNQVLVPAICMGTFLLKTRDPFGASLSLWWMGQSLMDLAPYIGDARALELELLGGGTGQEVEGHDWEAILGALGWLQHDTFLARLAHVGGVGLMLAALVWGGYILLKQKANLVS
jgi:hypothetical protein